MGIWGLSTCIVSRNKRFPFLISLLNAYAAHASCGSHMLSSQWCKILRRWQSCKLALALVHIGSHISNKRTAGQQCPLHSLLFRIRFLERVGRAVLSLADSVRSMQ